MNMIHAHSVVAGASLDVHWGNVGSLLGGLAAVALAVVAAITGTAGLGEWRNKLRKERELAEEQTESIRLDRRRTLYGWSGHGVDTYSVQLVTDSRELDRAVEELKSGDATKFVVLQVSGRGSDVNRADSLRNLVSTDGFLCRPPTAAEEEALERGRKTLLPTEGPEAPWPQ